MVVQGLIPADFCNPIPSLGAQPVFSEKYFRNYPAGNCSREAARKHLAITCEIYNYTVK